MTPGRDSRRLVPTYLATAGRTHPTRNTLDRLTVLSATHPYPPDDAAPARRRLVQLLQGGALTLSEAAAHLGLPVSVVRIVVADLVDSGQVAARAPIPPAEKHDRQLLERVLSGLRAVR
ncbi:DUF742 domain-containing protein [Streptomyces sp. NPDC059740]|uniref:DUF742 domain-containing protein n=1 Tax=Streptomyces sp. NPDC059740 TaxID=3346926 RepID=UPI00365ECA01